MNGEAVKACVWSTSHSIADTIARALQQGGAELRNTQEWIDAGQPDDWVTSHDIHIAYGILRGTTDVFKACESMGKPWANIDRGYFKPGHYDGYYRVSLRGTQHTGTIQDWMLDGERWKALNIETKPWRGFDHSKPVIIFPPTEYVKGFFADIEDDVWLNLATYWLEKKGFDRWHIRTKEMAIQTAEPEMRDSDFVYTFNCSLGWKALLNGIPVISDPDSSFVGRMFTCRGDLEQLAKEQEANRELLFRAMANLQLTLDEMREGKLLSLLEKLSH